MVSGDAHASVDIEGVSAGRWSSGLTHSHCWPALGAFESWRALGPAQMHPRSSACGEVRVCGAP